MEKNTDKSISDIIGQYGDIDTKGNVTEDDLLRAIETDIDNKSVQVEDIAVGQNRDQNEKKERGGKRFSSTYQPEKTGRRKNVLKHLNDLYELSTADVNGLIAQLLSLNVEELRDIISNPESSVIEIAYAAAIIKDIKKGKIETLETMLNRKIGRPDVKIRGMFGVNKETEQAIKDLFDAEAEDNSADN